MKRIISHVTDLFRPKQIVQVTEVDFSVIPEGHVPVLVFDAGIGPEHHARLVAEFDNWREKVRNGDFDEKVRVTVLHGGVRLIAVPKSSL